MNQYFPSMFFLTKMDPLTLQAFVFICPDRELGSLLALIPPHVATTWVSYLLQEFGYRPSTKDQVSIYRSGLSSEVKIFVVQQYLVSSWFYFRGCCLHCKGRECHFIHGYNIRGPVFNHENHECFAPPAIRFFSISLNS